jgi:hypothetical protein
MTSVGIGDVRHWGRGLDAVACRIGVRFPRSETRDHCGRISSDCSGLSSGRTPGRSPSRSGMSILTACST